MLQVKNITEKKIWEEFLTKKEIAFYPLFQSWNWGDVQKKLGFEVQRIGLYDNQQLVGICQIVVIKAKRGYYLHLRHGPTIIPFTKQYFTAFMVYIIQLAGRLGVSFVRLSPLIGKDSSEYTFFQSREFVNSPMHNMDAELCLVLPLISSEEQLLANMRKSHRYLIRKAEKMDIKIIKTTDEKEIDSFLSLYKDLSARKHFVPHKGIKDEFLIFSKEDQAMLFLAKFEEKIIAGALILFVGDMAIYHHGASLSAFKHIPASYLIQWNAIKEARKRGMKYYNFWGVAPSEAKNHPWQGLTLFKLGFSGEVREFMHAKDIPLKFYYWKTYVIEYITKKIKGYN